MEDDYEISEKTAFARLKETSLYEIKGRKRNREEWLMATEAVIVPPGMKFNSTELSREDLESVKSCLKPYATRLQRIWEKYRSYSGARLEELKENVLFFSASRETKLTNLIRKASYKTTVSEDPDSELFVLSSQSTISSSQPELIPVSKQPQGRPRRPFNELLTDKAKRKRTEDFYAMAVSFAEENEMELEELLAYINKRHYYQINRRKSEFYGRIANGGDVIKNETVDPLLALYIRGSNRMGRRQYTDLRLTLKNLVSFPPFGALTELTKVKVPEFIPFLSGIRAPMPEVLKHTIVSTINLLGNNQISDSHELKITFCCGADGSGSHRIYNTRDSLEVDSGNMIFGGLHVISIEQNGQTLYKEKKASSESERPLYLVAGKENNENLRPIMKLLEADIHYLEEKGFDLPHGNKLFKIKAKGIISQLDGKAAKAVSGANSSYCLCCNATERDAWDPEKIQAGFTVTRDIISNNKLFDALAIPNPEEEDELFIPKKANDYATRQGMTHQPMLKTINTLSHLPVLHLWIRILDFLEHFAYKLNARDAFDGREPPWGRGKRLGPGKEAIENEKKEFQEKAKHGPLALRLDVPDPSGKGGNSDTGNNARRFLDPKNRSHVLDLFKTDNEEERCILGDILQGFNVVARLISSKSVLIDTAKMDQLCKETLLLMRKHFHWILLPPSIHLAFAHGPDFISQNGGYGLGDSSEEPLESSHKTVRTAREFQSRKSSLMANIHDTMTTLMIRSDPEVRACRRTLFCTHCHQTGHTKRSCELRKTINEVNDDERLFQSIISD